MAVKHRAAISVTGPGGNSGWTDNGSGLDIAAATATTTAALYPSSIAPQADVTLAGGASAPDYLPSATAIMRLTGAQVAAVTALTAQTTLDLSLSVYRADVQLGGTAAFGWLTSGTGTPALAALTSVVLPAIPANTALVKSGTVYYLPLYPGDILVWAIQTSTSTVAVPQLVAQTQIT